MHQNPVATLHHRLNNIQHWSTLYPTKNELTFSKNTISLRHTTTPADHLPFGAERWLDEPALGVEGAKTWPELWDNLTSWLRAWSLELSSVEGDDWERLHALIDLLAADYEDDFYELEETITCIHRRMKSIINPPVLGKPCLTCGTRMHKTMGTHGWDGNYYCPNCAQTVSSTTWEHKYQERLKKSDLWVDIKIIRELFPGIDTTKLRKWVQRGKIEAKKDQNGKSQYRPGDIARLLRAD